MVSNGRVVAMIYILLSSSKMDVERLESLVKRAAEEPEMESPVLEAAARALVEILDKPVGS